MQYGKLKYLSNLDMNVREKLQIVELKKLHVEMWWFHTFKTNCRVGRKPVCWLQQIFQNKNAFQ